MSLRARIEQDIKTAMLASDRETTDVLRGIKSALLYVEVASGNREAGLDDSQVEDVLAKEAKKREESALLYERGGAVDKADKERSEKAIIEKYLPTKLTDEELNVIIKDAIDEVQGSGPAIMGKVIGLVKSRAGNKVDGAKLALKVKEILS